MEPNKKQYKKPLYQMTTYLDLAPVLKELESCPTGISIHGLTIRMGWHLPGRNKAPDVERTLELLSFCDARKMKVIRSERGLLFAN